MTMARIGAFLLVSGLLVVGCGSPEAAEPPPDEQRVSMVTELAPGAAQAVAESVNRFGFDLLGELADGTENAITSPVSAAALLAMVLAGTDGDTAAELADVLHLTDARDARAGALLAALADTDDVTLSAANGLWTDDQIPIEPDYLAFVRDQFAATPATADLAAPETAAAIDDWVNEQTEGRIPTIAEDLGLPSEDLAAVLLNTVYFLAEWSTQFDPAQTVDRPFTLPGGEPVPVPMMHLREQSLAVTNRDGYRMLRLPYGETGRYGMEILLPDAPDGLPRLLDQLDEAEWEAATAALGEQTMTELALPRFELRWQATLNDRLQALGAQRVFDPAAADFTPMSPADLYLDRVVQKTYLRVDEAGTEAAAVTGGSVGVTALQPELVFVVDRPFAFTISDTETGAILFLGAVTDPRG
ncbi:MAG TPA: serpin family protein [Natronosporangium sp.]